MKKLILLLILAFSVAMFTQCASDESKAEGAGAGTDKPAEAAKPAEGTGDAKPAEGTGDAKPAEAAKPAKGSSEYYKQMAIKHRAAAMKAKKEKNKKKYDYHVKGYKHFMKKYKEAKAAGK